MIGGATWLGGGAATCADATSTAKTVVPASMLKATAKRLMTIAADVVYKSNC